MASMKTYWTNWKMYRWDPYCKTFLDYFRPPLFIFMSFPVICCYQTFLSGALTTDLFHPTFSLQKNWNYRSEFAIFGDLLEWLLSPFGVFQFTDVVKKSLKAKLKIIWLHYLWTVLLNQTLCVRILLTVETSCPPVLPRDPNFPTCSL
jgi:hypothetical protein